jgi:hypothetical protein
MKKRTVITALAAVLLLAPFFGGGFNGSAARADDVRKEVVLAECDSGGENYRADKAYLAPDFDNYVEEASLSSGAGMVNNFYLNLTFSAKRNGTIAACGIPLADAYFEFYFYLSNADEFEFNGKFVVSSEKTTLPEVTAEGGGTDNCFYWETRDLKDSLKTGWNYIVLDFDGAAFNGPKTREAVYTDLQYLCYYDFGKVKPGCENWTWEQKIYQGGMYSVGIKIDRVAVTDTPRDYGGRDGAFITHGGGKTALTERRVTVYTGGNTDAVKNVIFTAVTAVLAAAVAVEIFLLVFGLRRAKR